jgi:hypothetical protein
LVWSSGSGRGVLQGGRAGALAEQDHKSGGLHEVSSLWRMRARWS